MLKYFTYGCEIGKVLIWPILLGIGQFFVVFLFTYFYGILNHVSDISKVPKETLSKFVNDHAYLIFFFHIILFYLFHFFYHSNIKITFDFKAIFSLLLGAITTLILSLFMKSMFPKDENETHLWMQILTVGITGPMLEELIFRGIMIEQLSQTFPSYVPYLIVTIIFALFHQGMAQKVYALLLGILFAILAYQSGGIYYAMLAHIGANTTTVITDHYHLT